MSIPDSFKSRSEDTAHWRKLDPFESLSDATWERVLRKLRHGYRFERSFIRQISTKGREGAAQRTVYGLVDGRTIAVFRTRGRAGFQADMTAGAAAGQARTLDWGGSPNSPWLTLTLVDLEDGAQITRVQASLDRPECSAAFHLLLEDTTLTSEMEEHFARLGRAVPEISAADDLLCRCMKVPRARVQEAIDGGLTTLTQVEAATGCGGVCGGCRIHVDSMLSNVDNDDRNRTVDNDGPEIEIHVPLTSKWGARFGRASAISVGLWRYLRPGVAVASILSLPIVIFFSLQAALLVAVATALIVAFDLHAAWRQWHEIFVQAIAPPVGIAPDEERPAGFAEDGAQVIRSIVMRKLPFWDWVTYKLHASPGLHPQQCPALGQVPASYANAPGRFREGSPLGSPFSSVLG
jgi:bacterioferritin-associated ferredoxin